MEHKELFQWREQQPLSFWLALQQCKGLGYRNLQKLAYLCRHDLDNLTQLSRCDFEAVGLSFRSFEAIQNQYQSYISQVEDWLASSALHFILPLNNPAYPALLKELSVPPVLLFGKGDKGLLSEPQIAVVGSRNHSPAGGKLAHSLSKELVEFGWHITSGLALGIDTQSHLGALAGKGKTLAVMATGIEQTYPKRNAKLAERIVAEEGCLLTEFPMFTVPKRDHFPRRNRIISGLSKGVLVVEAALKSGSLITAKYALEQNREVFAVPGSVYNVNSGGCHYLIKQGAKLTEQVADINEEFPFFSTSGQKNATKNPEKKQTLLLATDQLLASVGFEATSIDVVAQRSGLPVTAVMTQLLEYELRGLVAPVPGGYIRLGE